MRSASPYLVAPSARPHPVRALADRTAAESDALGFSEDVKLFVTGWLAGLVFFGTLLA